MPLHQIYTSTHPVGHDICIQWFKETFGEPQEWEGVVLGPVKLKYGYNWAIGAHRYGFSVTPSKCVWCNDRAWALYVLRWH